MSINDQLGEEMDEFRTTTGLKDDYDGLITDAYFGRGQTGDRMNLFLKVHADDGEEVEVRYGIGTGWETYDGGKTVEAVDQGANPRGLFNNQTAWAGAFSKMIVAGAKDELQRRSHALERRGPRDARLVVGLKFHWEISEIPMSVPKRDDLGQPTGQRENITVPRVLPTAYLGTEADQAPKATTTRRRAASATSPEAGSTSTEDSGTATAAMGNGIDPALQAKLKVLAKTNPFHEFVDKALEIVLAAGDDDVTARLGDEAFYESLKA